MSVLQIDPTPPPKPQKRARQRRKRGITVTPFALLLILALNVLVLAGVGYFIYADPLALLSTPTAVIPTTIPPSPVPPSLTVTPSPTLQPTETPAPIQNGDQQVIVITATPGANDGQVIQGLMVMAYSDFGYTHLFAYQPETTAFTRLTNGSWDDIHPALSPDGQRVAFASHRGGHWDLYILDLSTGDTTQVTNDLEYDGNPSWSPDGIWLAFEKYVDNNLEIYITPLDGSVEPVRLTTDGAADYDPAWYPADSGRKVAFVSNRSGQNDIWIADLDRVGESRFSNISNNPYLSQTNPAWSPEGRYLAWVSPVDNYDRVFKYEYRNPDAIPINIGNGSDPAWSPDGKMLLTSVRDVDIIHLTAYDATNSTIVLPAERLPGRVEGISWGPNKLPGSLPISLQAIANETPSAAWASVLTPESVPIYGRQFTIDLAGVDAPHPKLNAVAIEPFYALRDRTSQALGWDALGSLENAFVSLNEPLPPGLSQSWLYTGRAIALNTAYINVGFMKVVREDIGPHTYWHVYLRTANQDGTQGRPMVDRPWNFDARFSGDTYEYENGGALEGSVPSGYWVDFTALAWEYGWSRVPALSNWSSFYSGAQFNLFAITSGLDWHTAMLQLYPLDVFITPTPILPQRY